MRTEEFDYHLPEDRIAQRPVEPRDAARLLRVRDLSDYRVSDLPRLLRPGDVVVVNNTRVRAARLLGRRATGGKVEVLLLGPTADGRWEALVRPARRLQAGERLLVGEGERDALAVELFTDPDRGRVLVDLIPPAGVDPEDQIARLGQLPLPPYIHEPLDDPDRYQTVYARRTGSAAAPTAGLHFTPRLLHALQDAGMLVAETELRVGLDTFRPITAERIEDHDLHTEWCAIDRQAAALINRARAAGGRTVAIGTTVARTLESFAAEDGTLRAGQQATGLYITPGYRFRAVDVLMTNFHVPRSSLLVLVAAFVGDRWREAYEVALARGYRMLSFGDAMLVERCDA